MGPAGRFLQPPPRDFGSGRFCLASTQNGIPSEADLVRTLRRGMPGSAMPSWDWMPEADLLQLARFVRHRAVENIASELVETSAHFGDAMRFDVARALAREQMTPGAILAAPPAPPADDAAAQDLGRRLYLENCAACHGVDGRGRKPVLLYPETHEARLARDFTVGILKGGASHEEIVWRITAGMPGSGMPPTRFEDDNATAALAAYVRGMLPDGSADRLVMRRSTLRAPRCDGALPLAPDAAAWDSLPEQQVVLAPLSWHEDAVFAANLAFTNDGETLAVRVRWRDATRDDSGLAARHADGAALQFSDDPEPQVFGMGTRSHPVNVWHWKAFQPRNTAGLLDLIENPPHARVATDAPLYVPAPAAETGSMRVTGHATLPDAVLAKLPVTARAEYSDGEWRVVFTRSLRARSDGELALRPGTPVQVALALWNGAAGDRANRKSISIWQEVVIE